MLFNNDTKSMSLVTLWSSYILHTLLNCELYTSCHCTVCKSLIILNSEFVQLYSILYLIQISVGSGLIFIFNWEWWTLKQGLELGVGGVMEVCMCGSRSECPISISQINYFPMLCVWLLVTAGICDCGHWVRRPGRLPGHWLFLHYTVMSLELQTKVHTKVCNHI